MSGFLDDFDPLNGVGAAAPVAKKKKKVQRPPSSDEEEEEEPVPVPVKKAKKKVVAPPPDTDEDEEEPAPAPVKKRAAAAAQPIAPPPVVAAKAVVKKKKKPVISSDSSSSSSSSESSDEEGQPRRKKNAAPQPTAGKKAAPAAQPAFLPAAAVAAPVKKSGSSVPIPQATLFDFGDDSPFSNVAPAAIMPPPAKTKKVKQPVVVSSDSSDDSEPDSPPPQPKKKAAAGGKKPTRAADDAAVPAISMATFLGDDTDEALEGFNDLEVRPTKRAPKKQPAAAAAPPAARRRQDPGLDGDDQQPYDDEGEVYSPHGDLDSQRSPPSITTAGTVGGRKKSPKDWRIDFENTSTSMGMNKNIVTWTFVWKRQVHSVQLHHSTFGGKRKVLVDDRVRVQEKKPFADQSRYDLRIGEGPLSVNIGVQIKAAGLTAFTYELYIERQPYDQAQKFWLSHPEV